MVNDKLHPSPHAVDHMIEVLMGYRAPDALGLKEETVRGGGTRNNGGKLSFEQRPRVFDGV